MQPLAMLRENNTRRNRLTTRSASFELNIVRKSAGVTSSVIPAQAGIQSSPFANLQLPDFLGLSGPLASTEMRGPGRLTRYWGE
jgi:hypothetical protein